jgi:hypothetical protein
MAIRSPAMRGEKYRLHPAITASAAMKAMSAVSIHRI